MGISVAGVTTALLLAFALVIWVPEATRRRQAFAAAAAEFKRPPDAKVVAAVTVAGTKALATSSHASPQTISGGQARLLPQPISGAQTRLLQANPSPSGPGAPKAPLATSGALTCGNTRVVAPSAPIAPSEAPQRTRILALRAARARRRLILASVLLVCTTTTWGMSVAGYLAWYFALIPSALFSVVLVTGTRAARAARRADKKYEQSRQAHLASEARSAASQAGSASEAPSVSAPRSASELPSESAPRSANDFHLYGNAHMAGEAGLSSTIPNAAQSSAYLANDNSRAVTEAIQLSPADSVAVGTVASNAPTAHSLAGHHHADSVLADTVAAVPEPETHWSLGTPVQKPTLSVTTPQVEPTAANPQVTTVADGTVVEDAADLDTSAATATEEKAAPNVSPLAGETAAAGTGATGTALRADAVITTTTPSGAALKTPKISAPHKRAAGSEPPVVTSRIPWEAENLDDSEPDASGPNAVVLAFPTPAEHPETDTQALLLERIWNRSRAAG